MCFLPNPDNLPQVNHKNETKTDNKVENLEWCDSRYNDNYGTRNDKIGRSQLNHPNKSKTVSQYTKEGEFIAIYPSAQEAERQTGVDSRHISHCCIGKLKTAGGFIWRRAD